jgi:hypothetical protein
MNLAYDIPFGKGRHFLSNANRVVDGVLGGWQLYWIGYLQTGMFFSPSYSGVDASNTNTVGGLPNRMCNGNLSSDQRSVTHWFNPSCFAVPTAGTLGNSGAFVLEGPGYNMQHLSIAKTFHMTERARFTLTAAAANVLNHPNFGLPAANISSPGTVGVISTLAPGGESRQIELRGRFDF